MSTKLDKNILNKYLNEEMTMKEAKVFENILFDRLYHIVKQVGVITNRFKDSYEPHIAFDVGDESEVDSSCLKMSISFKGSEEYVDYILLHSNTSRMVSEINRKPKDLSKYDEGFPLSWLTEDFEVNLKDEAVIHESLFIKEVKEKKENKEKLMDSFEHIQLQIKSKLSPEELLYISFLSKKDFLSKAETLSEKKVLLEKTKKNTINNIFSMANKANIDLKSMFEKHKDSNEYTQSETLDSFIINNKGAIYKIIGEQGSKYNIKPKV